MHSKVNIMRVAGLFGAQSYTLVSVFDKICLMPLFFVAMKKMLVTTIILASLPGLVFFSLVARASLNDQSNVALTARDAIKSIYRYRDHDVQAWSSGMRTYLAPAVSRDLLSGFKNSGLADAIDQNQLQVRVVFTGPMNIRPEGANFRQLSVPVQLVFEHLPSGTVQHRQDRWLNMVLHRQSGGRWQVVQFVARKARCVNRQSAWIDTQTHESHQ